MSANNNAGQAITLKSPAQGKMSEIENFGQRCGVVLPVRWP